jgi:hypothetical protein
VCLEMFYSNFILYMIVWLDIEFKVK